MQKKYRLISLLFAGLIFISLMVTSLSVKTQAATTDCGDLFISEYIEGSSNNKALEIYNGTGGSIDLGAEGYSIEMYFNASTSPGTTIALSGSVTNGDVYIVADDDAYSTILAQADQTSTSSFFNGDDAVVLTHNGTIIDVIGQVGTDPGSEWGAGDASTQNNTLRRQGAIGAGDTDGSDAFDPSTEWDGFASNTFDGLGSHSTTGCNVGETAPLVSSTSPTNSASNVSVGSNIVVNFSENIEVLGGWYGISCTSSGTHTADVSGGPQSFTLNPLADFSNNETCTVTIFASQVTDQDTDDPPDAMNANYVWSFTTITADGITYIHNIQGTGDTSPVAGSDVTIDGIVVGDFQETVGGFYVQEEDTDADVDPTTSEGIYVYSTTAVEVGDQVQVTGTIEEYFSETQLNTITNLSINSTGNTLPSAASPSLPVTAVSDWERYEGMRVSFSQSLFVTEIYQLGRYGQLTLADQRLYQPTHLATPGTAANAVTANNLLRTIILDDGSQTQNPDPIIWPSPTGLSAINTVRGGDTVSNVEGVITYRHDFYRIYPTINPTFSTSNPRSTAPTSNGTLRVASFNVLNYFTTLDNSGSICGPLSNQGCRGADTATEFTRQRNKIINAFLALDADVVGLIEIENHPGDDAVQDLINGLNDLAGEGIYSYVSTGAVGTDAIRVALIYKPANVRLQGSYAVLDSSVDPTFLDDKNRPVLAQTFEEIATGERFTVAVNHLKSKGSSCDSIGDPDVGDGQGNCNNTRTSAATALANWLATDPTSSDDPDFLIMGDLNAYALEDPITAIKNASFTDLIDAHQGTTGYSYVFDGRFGYLDYAMASPTFSGQVTNASAWHINADEPISLDYNTEFKSPSQISNLYSDDAYRASDHDPVVIDLFMPYGLADMSDLASGYEVAAHKAPHAIWLGESIDNDTVFEAESDNASDNGVEILSGSWAPGQIVIIRVQVLGGSGWLSGWFDWNLNGVFDDPIEKSVNQSVVAGNNDINITVPAGAQIGLGGLENDYMPVRFRLYESMTEPMAISMSGPMVAVNDGTVVGGEVEDYVWGFTPTTITLMKFDGQTNQLDWLLTLAVITGFSALGFWGWRRSRKGKHKA